MRLSPEPAAVPASGRGRRAVFIDKDGTLVEDVPYNVDPALLGFTPHASAALRQLAGAGYRLVVVSNQPGLALGRFDLQSLRHLERALTARLALDGVVLDGFYICPHAPVATPPGRGRALACRCRKPAPGLLLEAARELGIDLAASWMIGDILDDVEAGWRAGCRTVHLDVGNETVWQRSPIRVPTHTAPHLLAAAEAILASAAAAPAGGGRRATAPSR